MCPVLKVSLYFSLKTFINIYFVPFSYNTLGTLLFQIVEALLPFSPELWQIFVQSWLFLVLRKPKNHREPSTVNAVADS